ncbi:uncharacterized protein [Hetaerina americana]|uniref:uncharacterized protein n=1 Tax=Hetaerina americana TaxID=62018 RepID=UPI003A7F5598
MKTSSTTLLLGVGFLLLGLCTAQSEYHRRGRVQVKSRPAPDYQAEEDSERAPTLVLRRVRPLLPSPEEQQQRSAPPRLQLYADEPQEEGRRVVVIPQAKTSHVEPAYGRQFRIDEGRSIGTKSSRVKETSRQPPVQTIRNYSKINDDGSFTFGYEAADGSFKEETRGTDCVVRGKYGYVDPDGNKREFTYVSGNPCDPNAVEEEDDDRPEDGRQEEAGGEENIPTLPIRPISRPVHRPAPTRAPVAPTTVFQQAYRKVEPTYAPITDTTRAPIIRYTKPVHHAYTTEAQPPATTYRPEVFRASTPLPPVTYATPAPQPHQSTAFNFDAELRKFQIDNNVVKKGPALQSTTSTLNSYRPQTVVQQYTRPEPVQQYTRPEPVQQYTRPEPVQPTRVETQSAQRAQPAGQAPKSGNPIYASQLVYDPSSGQYNTILYQPLPKLNGGFDINIEHRLQPYVRPQQQYEPQQFYRPLPQQVYQPQNPRQFYYVSPQQRSSLSSGQIDAFLKGQNIQF